MARAAIPVHDPSTFASRLAVAGVVALALLELLWELLLAPLGPRGSWLALKALPLAVLAGSASAGTLIVLKIASTTKDLRIIFS